MLRNADEFRFRQIPKCRRDFSQDRYFCLSFDISPIAQLKLINDIPEIVARQATTDSQGTLSKITQQVRTVRMELDFEGSRFRVTRDGNTLVLRGAMTDATPMTALSEFKGENLEVDLSGVKFGSFSGVCNLIDCLNTIAPGYQFINVPYKIHMVVLLTDARDKVKSFQNSFAAKTTDGIVISQSVDGATPIGSGATERHPASGISLAFSGYADGSGVSERKFSGQWASENAEEAAFWVDYFGFFANVIVQCEQILGSTVIALNRYLRLIGIRVDSFAKAWQLMQLPDRRGKWEGSATIDKTTQTAAEIISVIHQMVEDTQKDLARIMHAMDQQGEDMWAVFQDLDHYIARQVAAGKVIEEAGVSLGDILMSVEMFAHVRTDLNIGLARLKEDGLASLMESLGIMNPEAESNVEEARQEVIAEATQADRDLNASIVIVQAFDLVRQILEHRRAEVDIIRENLSDYKAQNIHWTMLRDLIIDKLTAKMVTDQEKKAFGYYLGYLKPPERAGQATSAPGDVMLF